MCCILIYFVLCDHSAAGSVHDLTRLSSTGCECSAAPVCRGLPAPAQRLACVCYHPVRGFARWSRVRQHLLLHQQRGQDEILPTVFFLFNFDKSPVIFVFA